MNPEDMPSPSRAVGSKRSRTAWTRVGRRFYKALLECRPRRFDLAIATFWTTGAADPRAWIEFHRLAGVEHFFIEHEGDEPRLVRAMAPYESAGWATLRVRAGEGGRGGHRARVLADFGGRTRWMAFIESNEFLFSPSGPDLRTVLRSLEEFGGVFAHALEFEPGPVAGTPPALTLEHSVRCRVSPEAGTRPIVNPAAVYRVAPDGAIRLTRGRQSVDETGRIAADIWKAPPSAGLLRIHRYPEGSDADRVVPEPAAGSAPLEWEGASADGWIEDRAIHPHLDGLRAALQAPVRAARAPSPARSLARWRHALSRAAQETRLHLPRRYAVTACLVFKDCAPYIREWIELHRLAGVEHFYLYNNNSTDDIAAALAPYIANGLVTYEDWPANNQQAGCYLHCMKQHGADSRWMLVLDDDEFFIPTRDESLAVALRDYEDYAGVSAFWLMFGNSGHHAAPRGLVTENFTRRRAEVDQFHKGAVDPLRVISVADAHTVRFRGGFVSVTDRRQMTPYSVYRKPSIERFRVNHYYTKSFEEAKRKVERRGYFPASRGDTHSEQVRAYLAAAEGDELNAVEDRTILRYLPALREAMAHPARR